MTVDFHNFNGSEGMIFWPLTDSDPQPCSPLGTEIYSSGSPDAGTGNRIGINLQDVTLNDILIRDIIENGC